MTAEEFVSKAEKIHKRFYSYRLVNLTGNETPIDIICPIHGVFRQIPHDHLRNHGCPNCYFDRNTIRQRTKAKSEFVNKAKSIHGNGYQYDISNYVNNKTQIVIYCPKHGKFLQTPNDHLDGSGCPKCSSVTSKPETEFLDYLQISKRHYSLPKWRKKIVDGYDPITNTIYEFLGDYWHGNPCKFGANDVHPRIKLSYGEICRETMKSLSKVKSFGYNVKFIWETDWKNFKRGITSFPQICSL
jgi:hypothetical protein